MFDVWHLGVPVRNLEESLHFYVEALGFEFRGYYGDDIAFISPPGKDFIIELMEPPRVNEADFVKTPHHLAFECEDIERFRSGLVAKQILKDVPEIKPSNNAMRMFFLRDPSGTPIQFYQGRAGFHRDITETISRYRPGRRPAVPGTD